MAQHFAAVCAFVARAKASGGRCIVHCAFGHSRSVTAVAVSPGSHRPPNTLASPFLYLDGVI